ncbi:rhomboid family intramembrane serine protease [Isachenkonia alkalipeptolytica]|uniref:Rhomboid family intramembrane serine protease n=1 Tax=Isachenkonia alkalipeptolytica TaxID=2565777 RepID=A0AA43XIQ6_9CLOT|nr:rhomboid family intramembrane serine protease [Isachenkonia alkalipeptolytica]NBG86949.1 rhomboid family intramembrane serine protease [Isachenkonia alkalipeptolytica]
MKFKNTFTNYLIFINALVFLLMFLIGGMNVFGDIRWLLVFGAHFGPLMIEEGQWFRLVTSMFIHGGLMHIFFNMYILYIFGNLAEKVYGSYKFLTIYVSTGIIAGITTLIVNPETISVGASGAIFGLIGLLFGTGFRKDTPSLLKSITGTTLLPMILINVFLGFTVPSINNAAHLGGLFSGFAFGLLTPVLKHYSRYSIWKLSYGASLLVLVGSFASLLAFILL